MVYGNMSMHLLDISFISFCNFQCLNSVIFIENPFGHISLKELDGAYFFGFGSIEATQNFGTNNLLSELQALLI